jgi:hypothetical protein
MNPWTEITEQEWDEALGCLPPEKWENVSGVSIFRISEHFDFDRTSHYGRLKDRCFTALLPLKSNYAELARQIDNATQP